MSDEARTEGATPVEREQLSRPVPVKKTAARSRFKIWRRTFMRAIGAHVGATIVGLMSKTWRPRSEGREHLVAARGEGGGHIVSLWHGSMLVPMAHHRGVGWTVLVSQSGDGALIASILRRFGYGVVRGSASRGGARALREMLSLLSGGSVLVITPDGPRGPRHSMSPGLAWMARATGYAIVPTGFVADRAWHLKSWDQFTIPKPFARVAFVFGPPIRIERRATNAELERASLDIGAAMHACERRAFEMLGRKHDP